MKKTICAVLLVCCFGSAWALSEKDKAVPFSLPGMDGKVVKLEDSLGKGYIVLNFWARWCESCREEVPELAALMKAPGAGKAAFIGVNVGDAEAKAQKFIEKYKFPYQSVMDKNKAVAKSYGVLGLPTTLIIAPDGRIVFRGSRPPKTFDFTK